jgi:hypothetical protein
MYIQKLRENFHQLKLRPEDDFERILLEDIGFVKREGVKDHVGKGSFVCLFAVFYSLRGGDGEVLIWNLTFCRVGYDRSLEIYYKA